jgi:non-specific serine/threonine protein kinase
MERLARTVSPFILRRLKTDKSIIADLPEKIEIKEYCTLSDEQVVLYKAAVDELREDLTDASAMRRRGSILATITKLKQICNHPSRGTASTGLIGSSGKLDRLEELLDEILENGEKAIVFTQYASFGALLQHHLQNRFSMRVPFLSGSVTMAHREEMIGEFQRPDGPAVFILSLKAGGTGLNLTAANHVIHYDRWWNSAVEAQATDRAFRIGQRRDVVVSKMICEGTLEERIDAIIESKRALAETLISGGETWITELADDEIFDILAFSATA